MSIARDLMRYRTISSPLSPLTPLVKHLPSFPPHYKEGGVVLTPVSCARCTRQDGGHLEEVQVDYHVLS